MTKEELLTTVQNKTGFVSIVKDEKASDSVDAVKEKRYLVIDTENSDGTKGIVNVYYILDTQTNEAWFYNVEPTTFDITVKSDEQQTFEEIKTYCKTNFAAYFLIPERIDLANKWVVVEAYTFNAGKLVKSLKMVYKQGTNPITHVDIV